MKASIIRCLSARADAVCDNPTSRKQERARLQQIFEANGYPENFVKKVMQKKRRRQAEPGEVTEQQKTFVKIPYVRGVSEQISKLLRPKGIQVAHSAARLKSRLVKAKDGFDPKKKKGTVYRISCSCGSVYIGESGRPRDVRLKEHVADIKYARLDKSATARHVHDCRGNMNPLEASTIATDTHWRRRKIREAIEIKQSRANMNLDEGGLRLSPIWDVLLA